MSALDDLLRRVGRAATAARIGARTLSPFDTNPVPSAWRHVTKLDPEDGKKLPLLYPLYLRHTDAVSVGGSDAVTARNTAETFDLLRWTATPAFHEPSAPRHVTERTRERAAFLAVPEVLNGDVEALVGTLGRGIEHVRDELAPAVVAAKLPRAPARIRRRLVEFATSWFLVEAVFEAYIVQNPDSAAARAAGVTEADTLDAAEARRRATAAERHLESEVIYVEYSGTFGGDEAREIIEGISSAVSWSRVWYGGGIDSRAATAEMLDAGADAVVVGDVFHEVAAVEADYCRRAESAFDGVPTRDRVREWVAADDIADSAAARYLSTVPRIRRPAALAERYLVEAVVAWLAVRARLDADEADAGSDPGVGTTIRDRLDGEAALRRAIPGDAGFEGAGAYLAGVAAALADDAGGVDGPGSKRSTGGTPVRSVTAPSVPVSHLGVSTLADARAGR